jgi:hypothetical protein
MILLTIDATVCRRLLQVITRRSANEVTALFTIVIAVTGIVALGFARTQLKRFREEAQVQHLLTLMHDYSQEPMVTYRKIAAQKWLTGEKDSTEMHEVLNYFETIGLLLRRGYLYDRDVWEMYGCSVFPLWWSSSELVQAARRKDCNSYTNLEYLNGALSKIESAEGGRSERSSEEQIRYWKDEQMTRVGRPLRKVRAAATHS